MEDSAMALFSRDKKKEEEPGFRKSTAMYLHDLCWMLSGVLGLFLVFFRIIVVSGPSMKRTLLDGDYLLLDSNLFYHIFPFCCFLSFLSIQYSFWKTSLGIDTIHTIPSTIAKATFTAPNPFTAAIAS